MDTRCLYRPDRETFPDGTGAPRQVGREGMQAFNEIAEYLDAHLMQPLYFTGGEMQSRVEQSLRSMSQAERVFIEIEMNERRRVMHSFDYDPVR